MKTEISVLMIVLLFTTCIKAFSQNDTAFYESFSDNQNEWTIESHEDYETSLSNGVYRIKCNKEDGGRQYFQKVFFDPNKDFEIETKITQTGGEENNSFGFIWTSGDNNDLCRFLISSNGKYKIQKNTNGSSTDLVQWTESSSINHVNMADILKIEKKGKYSYFYINNTKVNTLEDVNFHGLVIGFVVFNKIATEIDYLLVKQKNCPKINLVKNAINGYKIENLGPNINSEYDELWPVISPDGNTLYISRNGHPENIVNANREDVWYSSRNSNREWNMVKNIGSPINNEGTNTVISVSPDGNTLLLMNKYTEDGKSMIYGGISITNRTGSGWEIPKPIDISDYSNDSKYFSCCLSSDKQILITSIQGKDSYGKTDIYVSFKEGDKFSTPKNLGAVVNTFADDYTPFLASDNATLYYSSCGRPGIGDFDVYVTRRLDDSWEKWSEPQNLGPEINTKGWDAYYTVPASGEFAYMVSYTNSLGGADIFRVKLPETAKPNPVMMVHGKVLNNKTKKPIPASITYFDLETNKIVGNALASPEDGAYKIVLPSGKKYSFMAKQDGFYAISENLDASTISEYTEIEKTLYLAPVEVGEIIRLNNIFFDYNQASMNNESFAELDRLVELMVQNPNMKIEISGHTDSEGADAYNLKLSQDRATTVENYLLGKNISKTRVVTKGYGESKPLASNDTEAGKAQNRRVEFKILGK